MANLQEILGASNHEIDDAVSYASPLILRGLLYQLTGDKSLRDLPVGTVPAGFRGEAPAITDPEAISTIREKAAAYLKVWRDAGAPEPQIGPPERLPLAMELALGSPIPEAERAMWIEQLALDPMVRGLEWKKTPDRQRLQEFRVIVIGAGMSGLNVAAQLKHAGIPFTVLEKNGEVGGTWHENRYPGARVDSPSRTYFNAFSTEFELPNGYCPQEVNERYFNWVADRFALRDNIAFNTEVRSMEWDEASATWTIEVDGPNGAQRLHAKVVMPCIGFLNRPNVPDIEGAETFAGPQFHTARWPGDLELTGKRVAVIGSGATSYQMMPVLSKQAAHTTLFMRTPRWCVETPGYLKPFAPQITWLDRNFPFLVNFNRLSASWRARPEALMGQISLDKDGRASADNERMRAYCLGLLQRKFADRPDLLAKMQPELPPMSSRPIVVDSDDNIYDALLRDDVTLVTESIERIAPRGAQTADGTLYEADVIVYATGFRANDYLWPMDIRGLGGRSLGELWSRDGARAYIGTMLPSFPNLFVIYGPNMNPFGTGLSVTDLQEMQTRFALKCIEQLVTGKQRSVDVTHDAYERFNAELDRRQAGMVYTDPRITNYYLNEFGRCTVNSGFDVRLMWRWLRDPSAPGDETGEGSDIARPYFGADLVLA
jgi:4-hydroxyacetophenone monooxygenase